LERLEAQQPTMQAVFEHMDVCQSRMQATLERVEVYALTTARRVAVPAGEGQLLVRTEVGYMICSSDDSALSSILLEAGELEPGVRRLIQKILHPTDVFVDVGANIGMHTIAAGKNVQQGGRVIAFEPYPPTMHLLEQSIFLNGLAETVELKPYAVANVAGEVPFYMGATSGHHSLYVPADASPLKTVSVPVVRLDDVLGRDLIVKLVKVDVEGAEIDVVKGGLSILQAQSNIGLIVEFGLSHIERAGYTPQQWLSVFKELGFVYRVIDPISGGLQEVSEQALFAMDATNLLFLRPESSVWNDIRD